MSTEGEVYRVKPHCYLHVLDNNTNVTSVILGPKTFTRQDHEKVVLGPEPMIMVNPRHYCIIANPVARDQHNKPIQTKDGQYKLRHGDEEIRFEQEPFALYPGEKLVGKVSPLQVVEPDRALRLKAIRDFTESDGTVRKAGDEWLFRGPNTYIPLVEVQVVEIVKAVVLKSNQALKLRAKKNTVDWKGKARTTGEEWLVRTVGAYLVDVDEENVGVVNAVVLTDKKALSLRANRTFEDIFGKIRRAGQEWLVTLQDAETYIPDVHETVIGEVKITSLTNRQFCVVQDPYNEKGVQQFGKKELRIGERSFFLRPGESLDGGIQNVYVLGEDEALLLKALETVRSADGKEILHKPGQLWMEKGPKEYFPAVEVQVVEKRKTIPLDENEGIYVRDVNTGKVRAVSGSSYMLTPTEELWKKELPAVIEDLLKKNNETSGERDKTRVVSYRVPHNCVVQLYDYKLRQSRIIFGPELAMLGPDEIFSMLDLSGDTPKRPHVVKDIALRLGPDFMTDVVIVETADHARLSLKVNYNWYFEVDTQNPKMFTVKDFVGDCCKALASRVRGAVSGVNFEMFHRSSASIIREAVFGRDGEGKINNKFTFMENSLVVTNLDIQTVEPVDQRTRESLQKSVQLAIEITTKAQEANAKHESSRKEQIAMGTLERQKIEDEARAESSRKSLLQLQAESAAVEAKGMATAEARAKAEALKIEGETLVDQARLQTQAVQITADNELQTTINKQKAQIEHERALNNLEVERARKLAEIESKKFAQLVQAIGADTLASMAEAGPATQAKLLEGLGLKSFLITDGSSPVNLFNTANGLVGGKQ